MINIAMLMLSTVSHRQKGIKMPTQETVFVTINICHRYYRHTTIILM